VISQVNGFLHRDRKFVFVPEGYTRQNDKSLQEILAALDLRKLPPLLVVTAATSGAVEEIIEDDQHQMMMNGANSSLSNILSMDMKNQEELDLTEGQERELLREKTHEILHSTVELCGQVGAWMIPHHPRRVNGAAAILMGAIPRTQTKSTTNSPVVLGMIGLDQQDEKSGFAELIVSHLYPIDTNVSQRAEISYNPNVMDNTPCPELTHLIIFQRRQEMRDFRERLLSKIPDVFLAFGSTTSFAKKSLFSALVNQSPVALITHTSKEIDHISWMLKHADREKRKIDIGAIPPAPSSKKPASATHTVPGAVVTYKTLPIPSLRDLEAVDEELAQFLTKWPASHADERIIMADPRRVGGVSFQQNLLRAVNASYYLQEARKAAIQKPTKVLQSIEVASDYQNRMTEQNHLKMVLSTLAAVIAAVLYAKIYGSTSPPSFENRNPWQIILFLSTICLPFLIVHFKAMFNNSSHSWSATQNDEAKLQSAIYEFRVRPRSYGQSLSRSQNEPLEAFTAFVNEIEAKIIPASAESNIAILNIDDEADEEFDIEASPLLPPKIESIPNAAYVALKWKRNRLVDTPDFRIQDYQTFACDEYSSQDGIHSKQTSKGSMENTNSSDDGELLTIKEYIDCRIQTERSRKAKEIEALEHRNAMMEKIIKAVLASTSVLAILSKQWLIPVVLGISAAFVASQDFRKYKKRIEVGDTMIAQLDELISWWDCLEVNDKISNASADNLVQSAERIIMAVIANSY